MSVQQRGTISTVSETALKRASITLNPNAINQGLNGASRASIMPNVEETLPETGKKDPVETVSRIIFLKMGQIDTRNERYDAEAYIECTWEDDEIFKYLSSPNLDSSGKPTAKESSFKNTPKENNNIINVKNIIANLSCVEYDPNQFWSPQLYIENAIGDLKEDLRYKLEIVQRKTSPGLRRDELPEAKLQNLANNLTVRVTEMRRVRGIFYERLELYDFPMDIQEISITLTSKRSVDEVALVENRREPCSINIEDFLDQQEWDLFDFVKSDKKIIHDPWRKYERPGFLAKSYIARKPGYYVYNAYMLIFLITTLGFVPFAFDPSGPQFRCQVTGLLILTSVNFRWLVTQRLPSVPYLTELDKYSIGLLFHLVFFCIWHSIIGSSAISTDKKRFDCFFLFGASVFFTFYNFYYLTWFFKMSRKIKKFLHDGQDEAKKEAEARAIEFAERPSEESEADPEALSEDLKPFKAQYNSIKLNPSIKGNNNVNPKAFSQQMQPAKQTVTVTSSVDQTQTSTRVVQAANSTSSNLNRNSTTNQSYNMKPISEEEQRLIRHNSIGMKNMIRVHQNQRNDAV